ncbi:Osmosensitive K+ channel histidine kinase KdpD [Methylacidimicrobium sp. AP8]|uniref:sensor histidine kinase n=1 Tax=Methylacidimicrobium sp. AP8 TaxID=2730359 RepID=UPI0018C14546|nr:sensor histidine kinase KdpD [Methylacidimicrobium sp. AP8]CAB4243449.1 Osmosensitive K+ channel histidine kinase KdpD [Methylacidimicrobium sp. AP8]
MAAQSDERPNPDSLLAVVAKEEQEKRRGNLKIFLGMCPGVGKTFAMLQAARVEHANGRDVVIGYVETHGRKETEALAEGLPKIPRRTVEYRGLRLEEMDLDALLERRPHLAVVDELAHSNAPGSRHPKRYQDVEELLEAGIDVFTTLNVQHIESRTDTVRQITGAPVQETVPDQLIDLGEIEVIDLPAEDLLKRLSEGKVYIPERARAAALHFFREGNLRALREIVLRLAAEKAGKDVHEYMQLMHILGPWKTGHRLMVAVSASPFSEPLIRWTRRLADSLGCPWIAAYVESPHPLSAAEEARLGNHLDLARRLGGEVVTATDEDLVRGLVRVARQRNVTQIVFGKPGGSGFLDWFRSRSLLHRLARESGEIDLHIVRVEEEAKLPRPPRRWRATESPGSSYGIAAAVVAAVSVLNLTFHHWLGSRSIGLIYLLAIVLLALFVGRGPVLFAAFLSALLWDFFFLSPRFTLGVFELENAIMVGTFLVVALVLGQFIARNRAQEKAERRREQRVTALYLLTQELSSATTMDDIVSRVVEHIGRTFHAEVAFFLANPMEKSLYSVPHWASTFRVSEREAAVAAWAFANVRPSGRFTDNLPLSQGHYVPLVSSGKAVGVLGVRFSEERNLTFDEKTLLQACANQIALVVDRQNLCEMAEHSRVAAESERLSQTLLNSISHEMRTPLAVITAAVSSLSEESRRKLGNEAVYLEEIASASTRMNRIVENLLDMARLSSGRFTLKREWCDAKDLIDAALRDTEKELRGREIQVRTPSGLPLVRLDFPLVQQALTNLLLNAAMHTPSGTPVEVTLEADPIREELVIRVADRGPGLGPDTGGHLFNKFYRGSGAPPGGTGLGLSIVKGVVEAHGGRAEAENREGGGAVFSLFFPLEKVPETAVSLKA